MTRTFFVRCLLVALLLHSTSSASQITPGPEALPAGLGIHFVGYAGFSPDLEKSFRDGLTAILAEYRHAFGFEFSADAGPRVIIFNDREDYKRYQKRHSRTYSGTAYYSPARNEIVTWNDRPEQLLRNLFHEQNHFLLRRQIAEPPRWLNEGLSE